MRRVRMMRTSVALVTPQPACRLQVRFNSTTGDAPFAHVGPPMPMGTPRPKPAEKEIDYEKALAELEKLDNDSLPKLQWTGYGDKTFEINELLIHGSVIATPQAFLCWKPKTPKEITVESLSILKYLNPKPELLVLGTGDNVIQLTREVHEFLHELDIGMEVQRTGSALGTFLVLNGEDRRVVGAFLQADVDTMDPVIPQGRDDGDGPGLGSWTG